MELPNSNRRRFIIFVNVCRWLLATVMMLSGFLKAVDPVGAMYKLQEYALAFSFVDVSDDVLLIVAVLQAAVEFLLGLYLFVGIYRKVIPFMTILAMLLFTPLSFYLWVSGAVSDCGCFGESIIMSNGATFLKNLFLLFFAIVTFVGRASFVNSLSLKIRWLLVLFSWVYIFGLQMFTLMHLPLVDFGPYAMDNNIRSMVKVVPAEYEYLSLYKKGSEELILPVDSVPGSEWEFVQTFSEVVREGVEPEISNFEIIDWEGDFEITEVLLADTGYVCIVSIEDVESASLSHIDRINDLYEHCSDNSINFCAVSSSEVDEVQLWAKRTGAEYPVNWADATMLRSLIRSNPGLVLLKDGVIVGKWAAADIPGVEELENSPTLMPDSVHSSYDGLRSLAFWVIVLSGVLFLFTLLNLFLGIGRKKNSKAIGDNTTEKVVDDETSDLN